MFWKDTKSYLQITKPQTPLGSLPLTFRLQGPPRIRVVGFGLCGGVFW